LKNRKVWDNEEEKAYNKAEVLLWFLTSFGLVRRVAGAKARLIRLSNPKGCLTSSSVLLKLTLHCIYPTVSFPI